MSEKLTELQELACRVARLEGVVDFLLEAHQKRMLKRNVKDAERVEAQVLLRSWGLPAPGFEDGVLKKDGRVENATCKTRGGK